MGLLSVVDRELPRITVPALITHGRRDRTVDVGNAPHIIEHIGSTDKRLVWFERSGHAVTVDLEHDALFAMVLDWLNAH
jgi:carboxylesterase